MPQRQGSTRGRVLGMVAILFAVGSVAQADDGALPDAMLGVRVAPMLLLTRPDVRRDLQLTDEQVASAARTATELRARAKAIHGKGDGREIVVQRRAIDEMQWDWIATQLSAEQRERLGQIDLQWEGPQALLRPSVVEALSLDAPQCARLRQVVTSGGKASPPERTGLFRDLINELTPDQRERWKLMLGKSFQVFPEATAGTVPADAKVRRASGENR